MRCGRHWLNKTLFPGTFYLTQASENAERYDENIFSAGVWLASAPLHGSIRTRKSASTR